MLLHLYSYIAGPINNTHKINRAIVKSIYTAPPCIQSLFNIEKAKNQKQQQQNPNFASLGMYI